MPILSYPIAMLQQRSRYLEGAAIVSLAAAGDMAAYRAIKGALQAPLAVNGHLEADSTILGSAIAPLSIASKMAIIPAIEGTSIAPLSASGALTRNRVIVGNGVIPLMAANINETPPSLPTANLELDASSVTPGTQYGSRADWRFLHDGTGCSIYAVVQSATANHNSLQMIVNTNDAASSQIGIAIALDDRAGASRSDGVFAGISRGISGSPAFPVSGFYLGDNTAIGSDRHIISLHFKQGDPAENNGIVMNGTTVIASSGSNSPSANLPSNTLTIGARTDGSFPFSQNIERVLIYSEKHGAATRDQVISLLT